MKLVGVILDDGELDRILIGCMTSAALSSTMMRPSTIRSIRRPADADPVVENGLRQLRLERNAPTSQFVTEAALIDRFEQSGAASAVTNNPLCLGVFVVLPLLFIRFTTPKSSLTTASKPHELGVRLSKFPRF